MRHDMNDRFPYKSSSRGLFRAIKFSRGSIGIDCLDICEVDTPQDKRMSRVQGKIDF